jgi:hypothetical protein
MLKSLWNSRKGGCHLLMAAIPFCDLTGADLRAIGRSSLEACEKACAEDAACRGWAFISSWDRCALKKQIKGRHTVRMYGGEIIPKDARRTYVAAEDTDYSGKDYRKIAPLNDREKCASACVDDPKCAAFVLIEGYRVCWLKESVGTKRSKIFTCGVKE